MPSARPAPRATRHGATAPPSPARRRPAPADPTSRATARAAARSRAGPYVAPVRSPARLRPRSVRSGHARAPQAARASRTDFPPRRRGTPTRTAHPGCRGWPAPARQPRRRSTRPAPARASAAQRRSDRAAAPPHPARASARLARSRPTVPRAAARDRARNAAMVDRTSGHRRRPAVRDRGGRGWPSTNRGRESPGRPGLKPAPSPAPDRARLPAPRDPRRPPATWRAPEPRRLRATARTAAARPRARALARAHRPAPPAPVPPLRVPARSPIPAALSYRSQPAPRPAAPRPPPQRNPRAVHR